MMKRIHPKLIFAAVGLWLVAQTVHAGDWWNSEWSLRKKVTIDPAAAGTPITEPIGTAPVLLRLHAGNFQFDAAHEDGSDIRVVAADNKTLLPFHIERYDALMGEAFLWVKVPDVKGPVSFWLYYGNAGTKVERVGNPKATYDADTALVYHFTEAGTPPMDATSNGNLAQTAGLAVPGSFIGAGIRLDEKTAVTIPTSASLEWTEGAAFTFTTWFKPTAAPARATILSRTEKDAGFVVGTENGVPYIEVTRGNTPQRAAASAAVPVGSWHHLAVVAGAGKIALYLDGDQAATLDATLPALNSALRIGGEEFRGELDELQMDKVARPVGFLKLAALSQGDKSGKLLTVGTDEQTSSWFSGGYFGVIVKSLTVDGWVVICILAVMSLISWWVMVNKGSYLGRIAKGNHEFMHRWHEVSGDLTMLGHTDEEHAKTLGGRIDEKSYRSIRQSSIYRIYDMGLGELRDRLAEDERKRANRSLSAQSVQAIRAVLDGALVRETQKLNSKLVLLTIAISGGPFLGLLGTVVGVMITFAAIAQQGEVNVNGIAPGISAALLATVAGLAVAIPALFGYNYLLSRVKDATSDMQVFIDEFITKLAECYSGTNGDKPHRPALPPTDPDEDKRLREVLTAN